VSGPSTSFWHYLSVNHEALLRRAQEHLAITVIAVALGAAIGVALGILSFRVPRLRGPVLGTAGLILTIPSLALYALLVSLLGLGGLPVVVALTLYSLMPIVRNTVAGLAGVDAAVVEAAQGQGMGFWRRLLRIQLPLAWPVILAGIRVSAIIVVGIAALGAIVNGPGLGRLILDGLRRVGSPVALNMALAGTLGVVVLGVLLELFFILLGRLTTSRGVRG
jgi:osmoprotectant transport system permease protein